MTCPPGEHPKTLLRITPKQAAGTLGNMLRRLPKYAPSYGLDPKPALKLLRIKKSYKEGLIFSATACKIRTNWQVIG